ncbi:hypothetical protein BOTBODRAFT_187931 [Botryobasidium botryosum FD-172 SS1]|uniref:Uncharacterized protein n=1 Tax=Botryobasidium botryosum (strain FD-172 SS1) TaxID=930990 RepID=A0A067MHT7_BOTB1|nr:hypothetical protein BOTBODRAFT_187931 [Botryobasidium botryosum FD-172 SS1]
MTVPESTSAKNIWIAAGDGDLERVRVTWLKFKVGTSARDQVLLGDPFFCPGLSPNAPDPNTYTPMHAAASYGHLAVLEYLIQHGGNVNIADEDGDTPLYTVESVDVAQFLVDHGARIDLRNSEGISPAEHLDEDFPDVAAFLRSLSGELPPGTMAEDPGADITMPSNHATDLASERLTNDLLANVQDIMQRAEQEGRDPDDELRGVVGRALVEGMTIGREWDTQVNSASDGVASENDGSVGKKPRWEHGER